MSSRKTSKNKSKTIQLPPNALEYCPQYHTFDKEARKETKSRFREHVRSRRNTLIQCIDPALNDLNNPSLALQFHNCPKYIDNDDIINSAFNTIDNKINEWNGVQFSKNFKQQYNETGHKMNRRKFDQIAKNHQDQTSWKVSGNKFFAPYIAQATQYLHEYCQSIINISEEHRREICKFACISYAVSLLKATIRFHRTKPKPLIRYKTLVKSEGIHIELEQLYAELKVKTFIASARKKRKATDGKNTVKSQEFHGTLLDCCNTLYREQKKTVYSLRGVSVENMSMSMDTESTDIDDDLKKEVANVYPSDLIDSSADNNEDSDRYEPYKPKQSLSPYTDSTQSLDGSNINEVRVRAFQEADPREYGIRNDMNSHLLSERQRRREINIHNINHNNNNVNDNANDINIALQQCSDCGQQCHCEQQACTPMNNSSVCRQLQQENDRLRYERDLMLQQLISMDTNTMPCTNTMPVYVGNNYNYNYNRNPYVNNMPPVIPQISQIQIPQISQMARINPLRTQNRANSLYSMDINGISPATFTTDLDFMDIPSLPQ